MAAKTYDIGSVTGIWGPIIAGGYGDGVAITVEQNEDAFALTIGVDGHATRTRSNNRSGRVTFSFAQSSTSNDLFSAQHNLDLATPGGTGFFPFLLRDNLGTSLYTAESMWIVRFPTSTFDGVATTRDWILETDNLIQLVGSN